MHIQAYSIMIVIRTLAFFFHFNLTYFSTKFKRTYLFFDCNNVNFNAQLSLLSKWRENRANITHKLLENKFYDTRKSFMTPEKFL